MQKIEHPVESPAELKKKQAAGKPRAAVWTTKHLEKKVSGWGCNKITAVL